MASPEGGHGNPLQCSCLENPRDRGAWWAAHYGVAQSQTRLKQLSSSSSKDTVKQNVIKRKKNLIFFLFDFCLTHQFKLLPYHLA